MKGDNYSFVWKVLATIKCTVDAANPDDSEVNKNIYSTCDLAMGILDAKVSYFCTNCIVSFNTELLFMYVAFFLYIEDKL